MHIFIEIERRLDAYRATGMMMAPTVYAGKKQMAQLRAAIDDSCPTMAAPELLQSPSVMGMPLVEVVAEDYLRVA